MNLLDYLDNPEELITYIVKVEKRLYEARVKLGGTPKQERTRDDIIKDVVYSLSLLEAQGYAVKGATAKVSWLLLSEESRRFVHLNLVDVARPRYEAS